MNTSTQPDLQQSKPGDQVPIAIGGMGGSGTRLVANIHQVLGYYLGDDLNGALDNLLFTLLFKRKSILRESNDTLVRCFEILIESLHDDGEASASDLELMKPLTKQRRNHHSVEWLETRLHHIANKPKRDRRNKIAWKEPNTHVILDYIVNLNQNQNIKYVHVVRDGLDMAYSSNQQQLLLWGEAFLGRPVQETPADALDYWNVIHTKLLTYKNEFPERIEIISYDKLCKSDAEEIQKICSFAGITPSFDQLNDIKQLIQPSKFIGRGEQNSTGQFDKSALQQYRQLMRELV